MVPKTHIMMSTLIPIFLIIIMMMMKQNFKSNLSSNSTVECGFNALSKKNFKMSNQFFMIAIIFVIFDMELIAILPTPILTLNMTSLLTMETIVMTLAFSLLMEWLSGLTEWSKS